MRARYRHLAGDDRARRARRSRARGGAARPGDRGRSGGVRAPPTSSRRCSTAPRTATRSCGSTTSASSTCATTRAAPGERLRLWDRLGELCLAARPARRRGRRVRGRAHARARRRRAPPAARRSLHRRDPKHDARRDRAAPGGAAREQAPARVVQGAARRSTRRTQQPEKARAVRRGARGPRCARARGSTSGSTRCSAGSTARDGAPEPRDAREAARQRGLARAVAARRRLQLSALFALVAPAFAVERARMRPPHGAAGARGRRTGGDPRRCSIAWSKAFGVGVPAGVPRSRSDRGVHGRRCARATACWCRCS